MSAINCLLLERCRLEACQFGALFVHGTLEAERRVDVVRADDESLRRYWHRITPREWLSRAGGNELTPTTPGSIASPGPHQTPDRPEKS